MAVAVMKPTKLGLEEPLQQVNCIRITLTPNNVKNLEKVCDDLVRGAKDKKFEIEGTCEYNHQVLNIITGKSPCGEGTHTWDRFELLVQKRVIDLHGSPEVVKQINHYRTWCRS